MSEVKTEPVAATFAESEAAFFDENMRTRVPGALLVISQDERPTGDGSEYWYYSCPCGCGAAGAVRVKAGEKPAQSPSWHWNGSKETPTLMPSVHHIGHWHGWLTDGVWRSC
ncbi:DUF6527 family protein [Mesorhizobium sp. M7A.F.Ca.MR.245.00.0.0]|uniref:DUF6527 family protein n=1 Tax=Mesorhizobium sp. M7A.F.Ca.MR.245.00.0.0 TaxID=2496778 RepID=UPI000FC9AD53|nr:DUF6527 family protein [Mesorhizobium sp. M7A.F.Ca.MR.245.00.0.0]RUV19974.1 hypothetical protein EOB80_17325 [Mesorhizobium sp. M7A.F.Ca.MR.245.00.0.0]RUV53772.1 hypothetical protein EOB77_00520 [Mesorhizobium sp. M7A.F.Ca.MR.228.00.0.0]